MTEPDIPPLHEDLVFHGPLSEARADRLLDSLGPLDGQHVVDAGCGWAELLLRTVSRSPSTTGHGVDTDTAAIEHGRSVAARRGLADRVTLDVEDADAVAAWDSPVADVVIVTGAGHVWGGDPPEHTPRALAAARAMLRPGGRLLLGEGFWEHEPTPTQVAAMGIEPEEYRTLPDLVDLAVGAGFRPLALSQADRDEWDAFESAHAAGVERWLLAHPDSPRAEEVRTRADEHRTAWLRGWRGVLGFAYLTLARG